MLTDIILLLVGVLVGAINAIAGGGMLLGFPVMLALGMPPIVANATSHLIVMPGQIAAIVSYRQFFAKVPKHYLLLLIPCLIGGLVGAWLLSNTSSKQFEAIIPYLLIGAVALFIFQPYLHRQLHLHIKSRSRKLGPLFWIALATLPLAIYGGYFGAGFGFIMLAFLGFSRLHDIHQMQAIKNFSALGIAAASLIMLSGSSLIDWHHGLVMAAGCLVGGYFGAKASMRMSNHSVRVAVSCIGLVTAAYLVAG